MLRNFSLLLIFALLLALPVNAIAQDCGGCKTVLKGDKYYTNYSSFRDVVTEWNRFHTLEKAGVSGQRLENARQNFLKARNEHRQVRNCYTAGQCNDAVKKSCCPSKVAKCETKKSCCKSGKCAKSCCADKKFKKCWKAKKHGKYGKYNKYNCNSKKESCKSACACKSIVKNSCSPSKISKCGTKKYSCKSGKCTKPCCADKKIKKHGKYNKYKCSSKKDSCKSACGSKSVLKKSCCSAKVSKCGTKKYSCKSGKCKKACCADKKIKKSSCSTKQCGSCK